MARDAQVKFNNLLGGTQVNLSCSTERKKQYFDFESHKIINFYELLTLFYRLDLFDRHVWLQNLHCKEDLRIDIVITKTEKQIY